MDRIKVTWRDPWMTDDERVRYQPWRLVLYGVRPHFPRRIVRAIEVEIESPLASLRVALTE